MEAHTSEADVTTAPDEADGFPSADNPFRCLIEHSLDGFLLYDSQGLLHDANESACELHGFELAELMGQSIDRLFETNGVEFTDVDEEVCRNPATVRAAGRRKDGSTFPAEVRVGSVSRNTAGPFFALVRDVSALEETQERISFLNTHDELTALPNGRFFKAEVEEAIGRAERSQRRLAVLHVDLNRFGLINQALGAAGGAELLRLTASRLRE